MSLFVEKPVKRNHACTLVLCVLILLKNISFKEKLKGMNRMNKRGKKWLSMMVASSLFATNISVQPVNAMASIKKEKEKEVEQVVEKNEKINSVSQYAADENTPFSWDNANVYFVITDRFNNGDKSNDHSYGRSGNSSTVPASYRSTFSEIAGAYAATGEVDANSYEDRTGTFHGGDLKGLTDYINNGYFDDLGTNAIWITAPYEQIHGGLCSNGFKHYAYHGYYALDYTQVDANMGTAEDLHTFIDTAHEHGIRVIFDVVMNHSGYPDAYTIAEYYGSNSSLLTSKWQESYFGKSETKYTWEWDYGAVNSEHGALNYTDEWNNSWFTTGWQRMVTGRYGSGYTAAESGDELTYCSTGLPDFKTEDNPGKSLPDILTKKWTKEGQLSEKKAETEAMLKACGYGGIGSASVKQYLVAWLANWVREYGVDGFRCDTAKHVDISCWNDLKTECKKALKEWRSNNSDKECSKWTDDFWMTGEIYDQGLSMNYGGTDYSSAFDSLINFSFKGKEGKSGSSLESIYSEYANYCNSGSKGNALSYISSHDKGIGTRGAGAGTALLLLPGGVQTYYGDETARTASDVGEHGWRSQMTWNNEECLANWQKVGRFRRNHIAVGAGQHKKLSDSPYTFSRTYTGKVLIGSEAKTDYEDKVVVCLPGVAGMYDVTVKGIFEDGAVLVDEYSEEEYTVSNGKVTATCDSNGVILLAATEKVKPLVTEPASTKQPTTPPSATPEAASTKTSVPVETSTIAPTAIVTVSPTPNVTKVPTTVPTSTPTIKPTPTATPPVAPTKTPVKTATETPAETAKPSTGKSYRVVFHAMGGTLRKDSIYVYQNEKYGPLPVPSKEGYAFKGWFTSVDDEGEQITEDTIVDLASDQSLYAKWEANTYTITYDADGGTVTTSSKTVTYGQLYGQLPEPEKENALFSGWYTLDGTYVNESMRCKITSDTTLRAEWQTNFRPATLEALSYSFCNSSGGFEYETNYRPGLSIYQYVYGDTMEARKKYKEKASWTGSCFGMAVTSLIFNVGTIANLQYKDFNENASALSQLNVKDENEELQLNLTQLIEVMHVIQHDSYITSKRNENFNNLEGLCKKVEASQNGKGNPVLIYIYGSDNNGNACGHAIIGYKIVGDLLYVYDPNFPNQVRSIKMSKDDNGQLNWSYTMNDCYEWGTGKEQSYISYSTYEDIKQGWEQCKMTKSVYNQGSSDYNILTLNTPNAKIYDSAGKCVATITNGELDTDYTDIYQLITEYGAKQSSEIHLPIGSYIIENTDENTTEFTAEMINVKQSATVKTQARQITLHVDDEEHINSVGCNANEQQTYYFLLESFVEGDKEEIQKSGNGNAEQIVEITQKNAKVTSVNCDLSDIIKSEEAGVEYQFQISCSEGGKITGSTYNGNAIVKNKVAEGESVTFVMTPDEGYILTDVKVDGKSIGAVSTYLFDYVTQNHTIEAEFTKFSIENIQVEKMAAQTYTGKAQKPKPVVKIGNRILKEKEDYKLTYSNNIKPGIGKVYITGIGMCSGYEKTVTFNISVKTGTKYTIGSSVYKVIDAKKKKVVVNSVKSKKITALTIPNKIKIGTSTYKVTGIAVNALKGCSKLKKISIKATGLTQVGKNALKGIYKKAIIKVPSTKYKVYKKLLSNKGQKKTVQIKK